MIPSYDLRNDDVRLFKTPHHTRLKRDWKIPMVDVAMATTAAPTYLPAFAWEHLRLIDGGVWANNPAMLAVVEAMNTCAAPLEALRVFSLGTTFPVLDRPATLDIGGLAQWRKSAAEVIMRGQSLGANNMALLLLGPDRLHRVDRTVPNGLVRLDRASPDQLIGRAKSVSQHQLPRFEQIFGGHRAEPFMPIYTRETPPRPDQEV